MRTANMRKEQAGDHEETFDAYRLYYNARKETQNYNGIYSLTIEAEAVYGQSDK